MHLRRRVSSSFCRLGCRLAATQLRPRQRFGAHYTIGTRRLRDRWWFFGTFSCRAVARRGKSVLVIERNSVWAATRTYVDPRRHPTDIGVVVFPQICRW